MARAALGRQTLPMASPRRRARGFTLIEQLAVIAAVGATSAVALPQVAEMQALAEATALARLAAAAGSAMVLNQAVCAVTGQQTADGRCSPVADCADAAALLMPGLPDGYRLLPQPILRDGGPVNGRIATCQVLHPASGATAAFVGLSAGLTAR